ncbi:MAG: 2-oxoglutarate dehydrogenase complex dihydrolipoyllysine-residue succinyltransferase [Myxococcota bacterium]|nr:2-oxoglutarate dehydrogenase complex dihydrolipoyllysine-residue succinyltransferase [Myxococcota bacterium]
MATDIIIPEIGESITEGTILTWLVAAGEAVQVDQPLLELETDKVTAEIPSPVDGVLTEILFEAGADVSVGAVVARVDAAAAGQSKPEPTAPAASKNSSKEDEPPPPPSNLPPLSPAVRRLVTEHGLDPTQITGSGKGGRILKADVLDHIEEAKDEEGDKNVLPADASPRSTLASIPLDVLELGLPEASPATELKEEASPRSGSDNTPVRPPDPSVSRTGISSGRPARRVRMTRMRRAIARRLKEVQETAAILTTFNEVDMTAVMELRRRYQESFQARHKVKLGFMSFFVKAAVEALKDFPALNGEIDGDDLVFHQSYDIGVAVSSDRGLVVPVLRDADRLSFAEIEQNISQLAQAARDGDLSLEQLSGGTFSITNGGIFGSMLSTPILNPPQSGILGMHNIVRRPVAVGDQVEIRPVMYLALSYDHRIVDGAQAVRFLVKIKEVIEDPARLLLEA